MRLRRGIAGHGVRVLALCLVSLLGLIGCEGSEGQLVRSWTLHAPRGTSRIEMLTMLRDRFG